MNSQLTNRVSCAESADDLIKDMKMLNRARRERNNKPVTVSAGVPSVNRHSELVITVDKPKQQSDADKLMALKADSYVRQLEMQATVNEMQDWMGEYAKTYRLATRVMDLINMNLWREVIIR